MMGAGRHYRFQTRLKFLQDAGNILILQGTENEDDRGPGEILIQCFAQTTCRIPVVRRIDDNGRTPSQEFEASGPFNPGKARLDALIGDRDAAGLECSVCNGSIFNLMSAQKWKREVQHFRLCGTWKVGIFKVPQDK